MKINTNSEKARKKIEQYEQIVREQSGDKYNCSGIYAIYIDDILVYIGKSLNVLTRIAQHMYNTIDYGDNSNKYQVLREARGRNLPIRFDIIDKVEDVDDDDLLSDTLGWMEGQYIRDSMPYLNYQIPLDFNYHRFQCNKRAAAITLNEILEEG